MSALTKELLKVVSIAEENAKDSVKKYGLKFHLMPPIGWLNDPNGLCQFQGEYHVFFQYTPFDANGGLKVWGHYVSKDLLTWHYLGTPVLPDEAWDCHGAYSGSAWIDDGAMNLFYTGNVKFPGDFDYITEGRGSNTILITSQDGRTFSPKKCVLENKDYPENYTNHIRDPKVWKENQQYYMVLGGRKIGDKGAVLVYESTDKVQWNLKNELTTDYDFGYMWECPDLIKIEDEWFLALSPQGLTREEFKHQNVYQSGYFKGTGDYLGEYELGDFVEWDMGFDFYAPQTFLDEKGRRILIGWAGLPDIEEEYTNRSVEEGWQHSLTIPRVVTKQDDRLYQYPVEELKELRTEKLKVLDGEPIVISGGTFDLELENVNEQNFKIQIGDGMYLIYQNGVFSLEFTSDMGCGRTKRNAKMDSIHSLRVLCDVSLLEVYINEGEYVFTTRFYQDTESLTLKIDCKDCKKQLWNMKQMEVLLEHE